MGSVCWARGNASATAACAAGARCTHHDAATSRCYPLGVGPGNNAACTPAVGCRRGVCTCFGPPPPAGSDPDPPRVPCATSKTAGTCVFLMPAAPCSGNTQCASNNCNFSSVCEGDGDVAPVGFPCAADEQCSSATCRGGMCSLRTPGADCFGGNYCLSGFCHFDDDNHGGCSALPSATRSVASTPSRTKSPAHRSHSRTPSRSFTPRPTKVVNPGCGHGGPCYTKSRTPSRNRALSPSHTHTRKAKAALLRA